MSMFPTWNPWNEDGSPSSGRGENIKTLKKVTLPSTLKEIGWDAFKDNKNLTYINLPEGLTTIGSYAFAGCTDIAFARTVGHTLRFTHPSLKLTWKPL